ncbi:MAG: hypothetical protein ACI87V_001268 [Flavobacteriales bacterium]
MKHGSLWFRYLLWQKAHPKVSDSFVLAKPKL